MKNILTVMIMSIVAFSLNAHADDFSITIDAEKDVWYYQLTGPADGLVFMPAKCHLRDIGDGTGPDDDTDLSAIVWLSYDEDYLYCYVEVKDDIINVTNGSRYQNDNIELKFDPDPSQQASGTAGTSSTRTTALGAEDAQQPNGAENLNGSNYLRDVSGNSYEPTEDDYARRLTDDGYVLEIRVPIAYINTTDGRSLQDNDTGTFGLAINVADNDDVERTDMLQWSAGHADAAWNTPSLLGSATFMDNHILKLEAVSPMDPSIVNENADDWYSNPNLTASDPSPADGSTDVPRDIVLSWMAGKYAVTHDVYLGTDVNDVNEATIDIPSDILVSIGQEERTYDPNDLLEYGQTYYWRIDEVNDLDPNSPWKGDLWSFTIMNFIVVDDFESYNDLNIDEEGNRRIYLIWMDGYDNPSINGSTIGYPEPVFADDEHFVETDIVYTGDQSAPIFFDNTTASYSEVTISTDELPIGQDWTVDAPDRLSLWVYGDPNNSASEQMYVKINDAKATLDVDLTQAEWQELSANLTDFSTNLNNVMTLSIGFERTGATGGSGVVFVDDIRLYRPAVPTLLSVENYSFELPGTAKLKNWEDVPGW